MIYRKDIDGLRAIAVLAVIFYHLGLVFVPGGFVGVDIFFVISGFLITQTIQKDIAENKFTITHFYVKRIRRIVPALFVITLTTIVFSLWILPISEMKEFAKSVVSVSTFTSNLFFWQHSDYFSVAAELKPLLHTWSLGIEEQFYILFPIFMLFTQKLVDKKIIFWIFLFLFFSFALSASPFGVAYPSENFYLPMSRFWELLVGAFLALSMKHMGDHSQGFRNLVSYMGLLLIMLPVVFLDQHSVFPGVNALYPVIGAALIIYSGSKNDTYVSVLLSNRYVRYIGLISYSLYLWHWPIISLVKNVTIGEFTIMMQLSILVLIFVLSALTYTFVEQPFRQDTKWKNFLQIKMGLVSLGVLAVLASVIYIYIHMQQKQVPHINTDCFKYEETVESTKTCSFGVKDSDKIFLLYGDSHADAMYPAFEKLALENGWRGIPASFRGCAPLFGVFRLDGMGTASNCTGEYAKNVEKFLEENKEKIDKVFLVSRWTLYEKGWIKNGRLQRATHFLSDKEMESKNAEESGKVLKSAFERTVRKISEDLRIQTIIVKSPPALNANIHRRFGVENVKKESYINEMEFIDSILRTLAQDPLVSIVDPIDIFCSTDVCKLYENDNALYKDDNHVSLEGAFLYYPLLKSMLDEGGTE